MMPRKDAWKCYKWWMSSVWKNITCKWHSKTEYRPLYILYDVAQIKHSKIQTEVLNTYWRHSRFISSTPGYRPLLGNCILKVTHDVHQSRDFGLLLIVFYTTPFPPKLRKAIQSSIIFPIRNPTQGYFRPRDQYGFNVGTMHQTTQRIEDRMPEFVSRLRM